MAAKRKTKPDYGQVEKDLRALERRLQEELIERLGNVKNTSLDDPTELLDLAAEGEIDFMSAVSAESGSVAIDEIQHALQKIKDGSYGVCDGCHKRIRKRRLKARPFAVLCIHCKESQERLGYVEYSDDVVSARGDGGVSVSLTEETEHAAESARDQAFRDLEDMEISGLY